MRISICMCLLGSLVVSPVVIAAEPDVVVQLQWLPSTLLQNGELGSEPYSADYNRVVGTDTRFHEGYARRVVTEVFYVAAGRHIAGENPSIAGGFSLNTLSAGIALANWETLHESIGYYGMVAFGVGAADVSYRLPDRQHDVRAFWELSGELGFTLSSNILVGAGLGWRDMRLLEEVINAQLNIDDDQEVNHTLGGYLTVGVQF